MKQKILLIAALLLLLSGCAFSGGVEKFYSLPQQSEENIKLQGEINKILSSGAMYSAPASGSYRQSVQRVDIMGDGADEAVAFFNVPGDKPLKICIFQTVGDDYETAAVIEGDGTAINSINYADLNSDGKLEVIVGWEIAAGVQMLGVYSLPEFQVTPLLLIDYSDYVLCDMDQDSIKEITVLRSDAETGNSIELYNFDVAAGEFDESSARLSPGMTDVLRIQSGLTVGETTALFVDGTYQDGRGVTDVFVYNRKTKSILNVSADKESGDSLITLRDTAMYSRDLDSDGIMEVPVTRPLSQYSEQSGRYFRVDWMRIDKNGKAQTAFSTYHNNADGWYLYLDEAWKERLVVRRSDAVAGERAVIFSIRVNSGAVKDFLTVYSLSGDNKGERAALEGRFVLMRQDTAIYAARLMPIDGWKDMPDKGKISESFGLIYSEWITGTA